MSAAMQESIVKEGNLQKKSRGRSLTKISHWQLRKLSLTATRLHYAVVGSPPKDSFPLRTSTKVCKAAVDGKDFAFLVETDGEELYLAGASETDRKEWVEAVEGVVRSMQEDAGGDLNQRRLSTSRAELDRQRAEREKRASEEVASVTKVQQESQEILLREQQAAAAAQAAQNALLERLRAPCFCQKKLSTETSFHDRYIWVNPETKEFHWAKSAEDVSKSKCISIATNILGVKAGPPDQPPSFSIHLADTESLPPNVFGGSGGKLFMGLAATPVVPTGMDIQLTDRSLCDAFVRYLGSKGTSSV